MEVQDRIRNVVDEILIYLAKIDYREEIKSALKIYKSPFNNQKTDLDLEQGFNDWLIHDYKKKDGSYIASDYFKNINSNIIDGIDYFKVINNSIFSVYKVSIQKNNIIFKDIVTRVDYLIDTSEQYEDGDIIKVRLYPINNKNYIIENGTFYKSDFEKTIRKSIMSKYNDYCSVNEPMDIYEFVKDNSILIYHLTNIIKFYEDALAGEDDLCVYIGHYVLKNRKKIIEMLKSDNQFQLEDDYNDETIFTLLTDKMKSAEIVVAFNKIEIEATSKTLLTFSKSALEMLLNDLIAFVKDEELFLEDLL